MGFLLRSHSIATEVFGSTMLKLSQGFKRKVPIVGLVGTALTAIVGVHVFRERISPAGVFGSAILML